MTNQGNVLVTGSEGLLGQHICRRLADRYRVFGLDVKEPQQSLDGVTHVECDLTDDGSVQQAVDTLREEHGVDRIASVVHLAAYYDFSGEESPLYEKLSVQGTRRLLKAVKPLQPQQFLMSSSILCMRAAPEGQQLDEQSPELASWPYPQSKLDVEHVLRSERGDVPVTVLRIAGCYDEMCHSIPIAQQIRRIHKKQLKSLFFPGNADHGQAFVHTEDVADCVVHAVDRREQLDPYDVFLVAEPTWLSYRELQEVIGEKLHGTEWATLRVPGPLAKAGAWIENKVGGNGAFIKPWMIDFADAHYPADIGKAREKLQWEPLHRLPRTLETMLERLQEDPEGWYLENGLDPDEDDEQASRDDQGDDSSRASSREHASTGS